VQPRFVPPTPNCGHDGSTFTFSTLAELWMCTRCVASVGALYQTCSICGCSPQPGTQLVGSFRVGLLCFTCRRDHLAQRRIS